MTVKPRHRGATDSLTEGNLIMDAAKKHLLESLIRIHHMPVLATREGMVYQVWEDGEVTLQKSGSLLWQRTLHVHQSGDTSKSIPVDMFPCKHNGHGYIFTDHIGAESLRLAILGE